MNFMKCTMCQCLVNVNATGVCMACQMQNGGVPQSDTYKEPESAINDLPKKNVKNDENNAEKV